MEENIYRETITTNTGKEFTCNFFGLTSGADNLQIIISDAEITDIITVFMDSNETRKLTYMKGRPEEITVYNYIIVNVVAPGAGSVRISLRRPYVGELPDYLPCGEFEDERQQ